MSLNSLYNKLTNLREDREQIEKQIEELKQHRKTLKKYKNNFDTRVNYEKNTERAFNNSFWKGSKADKFEKTESNVLNSLSKYDKKAYDDPLNYIDKKIEKLEKNLDGINSSIWAVKRQIRRAE